MREEDAETQGDADVAVSADGALDQAAEDIRRRKSRWADATDMDAAQDAGLTSGASTIGSSATSQDVSERLAPSVAEIKREEDEEFFGPSLPPIQCKLQVQTFG